MKKTFEWYEKITLRLDKAIAKFFIFDIIIAFAGSLCLYILKDKLSSDIFLLFKSILHGSLLVDVLIKYIIHDFGYKNKAAVKHAHLLSCAV